ncbi:MAG: DUF3696 domain-containing protein [Proteobacteria bacterium]|nr:DUF3696 domain-containing protein [Pseudomonadota bacterium]
MITDLSMKNFKAFEDEALELGSLTILTGLNSSGKSSAIQALRLINEGKTLAGLGSLREYVRNDSSESSIACTQKTKNSRKELRLSFNRHSAIICSNDKHLADIVSYISADRLGPRNTLPLSISNDVQTVGNDGENIIDFLHIVETGDSVLLVPAALALSGTGVRNNIQEWLRVISPGVKFDYERYVHADMGRTEFNGHRSVHVGYGLSCTLPIIASILVHASQLSAGDIKTALLLLENPEVHLHPSGQTKMGEMLAYAASCGLQIIVETHSDHLLNGVRIAIKEGKLRHTDAKCYFFKADAASAPTKVERLTIDQYGMLDHWPDGFFDEMEKSLMQLI